jgi:hypothetical protein
VCGLTGFRGTSSKRLICSPLLKRYGVVIQFLENDVEVDTPESKIIFMLNQLLPEIDNDIVEA